ncbi:signal peptidase I [Sulfurimonas microaerophilic]|uniref:signal peptidase I n=1 Tax=Sulfurimonas microaerophilic TaxID=3058392 RepID=UPI0027148361|nr:signal peptidase I [Sulfurimonas sp. hsl 1-7]
MKNALYKAYKFSNSWTGTIIIVLFVIFFIAQAFRIPSGSMKDSLLVGDHLFGKKFAYGIPMPHIPFLELSIMPWSDDLKLIDGDTPKRGDIVIFRPPHKPETHFVKRCVGLPGDMLFVKDKDLYLHPSEGNAWIQENYKGYEIVELDGKLWVVNPYMKDHKGIHHDDKMAFDSLTIVDLNGQIKKSVKSNELSTLQLKSDERIAPTHLLIPPVFNTELITVEDDHYFMMGDNRDHSNDSRFWGSVPYENLEGTPWFIYFSIDKNWQIRWDRIGKTPTDLEQSPYIDRAIKEREEQDKDYYGIT